MNSKRRMLLLLSVLLSLMMAKHYLRKRLDVTTTTDWLAPILWEGTFSTQALDKYYQRRNITVGLAVFASGRFADKYLELFLQSANKYFMPGHRVVFYIMTDSHLRRPSMALRPLCTFQMLLMEEETWWSDVDLVRMKVLGEHIVTHILQEADFLFSMAANLVFQDDFGVETLGTSVAQLHGWWYFRNTRNYPYERQSQSAAYIPFGQGDFFYGGSIVGGTPQKILDLIREYLRGVIHDLEKGLNSTFERYLNKFFFLNKPAKLLSPEYGWDSTFNVPPQVHYVKVALHAERR
ncbi:putative glycosyltransferase 6 domain-containing protein 1 [Sciurus carolinensis]|uniref:putative glycosyltransferase 6 domain-containing protein 1 n=1 Tax=Sciurus carolinensis TaxID=30640 RepID=UPI001FB41251|nr:putative glycosyltransferase 6 domain-containing protein 1 [Sciurus carolinensis]